LKSLALNFLVGCKPKVLKAYIATPAPNIATATTIKIILAVEDMPPLLLLFDDEKEGEGDAEALVEIVESVLEVDVKVAI